MIIATFEVNVNFEIELEMNVLSFFDSFLVTERPAGPYAVCQHVLTLQSRRMFFADFAGR